MEHAAASLTSRLNTRVMVTAISPFKEEGAAKALPKRYPSLKETVKGERGKLVAICYQCSNKNG
jgi:hypothetical protein